MNIERSLFKIKQADEITTITNANNKGIRKILG